MRGWVGLRLFPPGQDTFCGNMVDLMKLCVFAPAKFSIKVEKWAAPKIPFGDKSRFGSVPVDLRCILSVCRFACAFSVDSFSVSAFCCEQEMLKPLVEIALQISKLRELTGRTAPTVIT